MISAIGGTIWSTTVQKLPTGPADHRHSVGYRTVEPHICT